MYRFIVYLFSTLAVAFTIAAISIKIVHHDVYYNAQDVTLQINRTMLHQELNRFKEDLEDLLKSSDCLTKGQATVYGECFAYAGINYTVQQSTQIDDHLNHYSIPTFCASLERYRNCLLRGADRTCQSCQSCTRANRLPEPYQTVCTFPEVTRFQIAFFDLPLEHFSPYFLAVGIAGALAAAIEVVRLLYRKINGAEQLPLPPQFPLLPVHPDEEQTLNDGENEGDDQVDVPLMVEDESQVDLPNNLHTFNQ